MHQIGSGRRNGKTAAARAALVAHERDGPSVSRTVEGQFGFGTEAGDHLVGGNGKRTEELAVCGEVVDKDRRGNAKAPIGAGIVPYVVIVREVRGFAVVDGDTAGDGDAGGAIRSGGNVDYGAAVGATRATAGQGFADGDG